MTGCAQATGGQRFGRLACVLVVQIACGLAACTQDGPDIGLTARNGDPIALADPAAPDGQSDAQAVAVLKVSGAVEARGAAGWLTVQVGDRLQRFDAVRTGPDGAATLDFGAQATIELHPDTQLSASTARPATPDGQPARLGLSLEQGRITTAIKPTADGVVVVSAAGSDAVASAASGSFSMTADGRGQVAVAGLSGSVRLSARDKSVIITAGQQSVVASGLPPAAPAAIPSSLFLKVGGPGATVQREHSAQVSGKTAPGALVWINGALVTVGPNGEFKAKVPLAEGANRILVKAVDAAGRVETSPLPPIVVNSRAPPAASEVVW